MSIAKWLVDFTDRISGIGGMRKEASAEERKKARDEHMKKVASMARHNPRVGTGDRPETGRMEVKGRLATGFMSSPDLRRVSLQKPADLLEIVAETEKRYGISLTAREFGAISDRIRADGVAEKGGEKLAGAVDRLVKHALQARIGRSIRRGASVVKPTFRESVADLELLTDRPRPSPQQELESLRQIRPKYPKDKDPRSDETAKMVREERDTKKQISKEENIDRTLGLSAPGTKPDYPFKGASLKTAQDEPPKVRSWEERFPTRKLKFKRREVTPKKLPEKRMVEAPVEIADFLKSIEDLSERIQKDQNALAAKAKEVKLAVQNAQKAAEEELGVPYVKEKVEKGRAARVEELDDLLDAFEGKMPEKVIMSFGELLMTVQDVAPRLTADDYKGILNKLSDMYGNIEDTVNKLIAGALRKKGKEKELVVFPQPKKGSFKRLAEILDEMFGFGDALRDYMSAVEEIESEMDELQSDMFEMAEEAGPGPEVEFEPEPLPLPAAASLSEGDVVVSRLDGTRGVIMKNFGKIARLELAGGRIQIMDASLLDEDFRKADPHEAKAFILTAEREKDARLTQKTNPKTGKREWCLTSRSKPYRTLKWFGAARPSKEAVRKEEKRVQFFKHKGGSLDAKEADGPGGRECPRSEREKLRRRKRLHPGDTMRVEEELPRGKRTAEKDRPKDARVYVVEWPDGQADVYATQEDAEEGYSDNKEAMEIIRDSGKYVPVESAPGAEEVLSEKPDASGVSWPTGMISWDKRAVDVLRSETSGTDKMAEKGRPNDIDRCRDCAYYESGLGTVYDKCAECFRAYTEDEIKGMEKADQDLLKDYFMDRGQTEVTVPATDALPAFEKKHASLSSRDAAWKSTKPPKKWWNQKVKEVKKGNPDYTEEQVSGTVGQIWSDLPESKKKTIRRREGKEYGTPKKKSGKEAFVRTAMLDREEIEEWIMNDEGLYNWATETVPGEEIGDDNSAAWNAFIDEHGEEISGLIQKVLDKKPGE